MARTGLPQAGCAAGKTSIAGYFLIGSNQCRDFVVSTHRGHANESEDSFVTEVLLTEGQAASLPSVEKVA